MDKLQEYYRMRERYKGRIDVIKKARKEIFKDMLVQPVEREFKDIYRKEYEEREENTEKAEQELHKKNQELSTIYSSGKRNIKTIKQKMLEDVQKEHPKMVSEEDIIKCQY